MLCPNCGKEIQDDADFCELCGTKIDMRASGETNTMQGAPQDAAQGETPFSPTPNITFCEDGVYRWVYELSMLRNPTILFTVFKILGIIYIVTMPFILVPAIINLGFVDAIVECLPFLLLVPVFIVIILISYLIVTLIHGGKYVVLFEMNEKGIKHIQDPKSFDKGKKIAAAAVVAGAARGNIAAGLGQGTIIASHSSMTSHFDAVRKIKVIRRLNTIKLDAPFSHNQIYAADEDFDFVLNYIMERIPDKAKNNK